jgi:hypothetical protein
MRMQGRLRLNQAVDHHSKYDTLLETLISVVSCKLQRDITIHVNSNNNNNNSIMFYLCAKQKTTRPITDTAQCRYK